MLLVSCPWCESEVERDWSPDDRGFVCPCCLTQIRWVEEEARAGPSEMAAAAADGSDSVRGRPRALAPAA